MEPAAGGALAEPPCVRQGDEARHRWLAELLGSEEVATRGSGQEQPKLSVYRCDAAVPDPGQTRQEVQERKGSIYFLLKF